MSMHLRGSRDMMGQEDEGWWKSRTGLEQKLIILSTLLFIVAFSLTITVIVLKNQQKKDTEGGTTTISPITPTGTAVTGEPSPTDPTAITPDISTVPSQSPEPSPSPGPSPSPSPSPGPSASPSISPEPQSPSPPTTSTEEELLRTSSPSKTENAEFKMIQDHPAKIVKRLLMANGA